MQGQSALNIFEDFLSLIYPRLCLLCDAQVQKNDFLCLSCETALPKTDYHFLKDNPITAKFYGRINIEFGAAYYLFGQGNKTKSLIHQLKYRNKPKLGYYMGLMYGKQLCKSPIFPQIDYIIPVPLHPIKQHQRGYNQSECIARGLSDALNIPVNNQVLFRTKHTETQTQKARVVRMENVNGAFIAQQHKSIQTQHILLVDDVLTTGATLEACALVLLDKFPTLKISIITMAVGS